MAATVPGRPGSRKRIEAGEVYGATHRYCEIADEVTAYLLRHGLRRKEMASVLHIALSKVELYESLKSQEGN